MQINKKRSFGSLLEGFKSTLIKKHYVSSAIFPVIISKQNDLHIIFLNYWKNKNKIDEKNLRIFTKIYNTEGYLVCHHGEKISKFHNQLSIKNILKKYNKKLINFIGSVNVEILSLERISYPFPAITAIYNSKNIYSAIHSADASLWIAQYFPYHRLTLHEILFAPFLHGSLKDDHSVFHSQSHA